jgi:hypothetical protein
MKQTILIYGTTGNGKTSLAATAEHPIKFLDVEARAQNIHPDDKEGIEFERVKTPEDIRNFYLKNIALAKSGKFPFKTIVIDSLREVQRIFFQEYEKKADKSKDNWKWTAWDREHADIHNFLRSMRDFPVMYDINLIMTCPAYEEKDGETTVQFPLLDGLSKFINEVMGQFDSIFYIQPTMIGNTIEYKLITRNTGKIKAKNPSRTLATVLDVTEGKDNRWTLKTILEPEKKEVTVK